MSKQLSEGDRVIVPWGLEEIEGTVIEVWGNPPAHVRVQLHLRSGSDEEPIVLLSPSVLTAA